MISFVVEVAVSRMYTPIDNDDVSVPYDVVITIALDFTDDCSLFERKLDEMIVNANGSYEILNNEI